MLKIIEDKNLCSKRGVDGMYLCGFEEIIVEDRNNKPVLVHELSHYFFDIGSCPYLDFVLDLCDWLGVTFWEVVDIERVSELCYDYEEMIDEVLAYFCEEVYKEFPLFFENNILYKRFLKF